MKRMRTTSKKCKFKQTQPQENCYNSGAQHNEEQYHYQECQFNSQGQSQGYQNRGRCQFRNNSNSSGHNNSFLNNSEIKRREYQEEYNSEGQGLGYQNTGQGQFRNIGLD